MHSDNLLVEELDGLTEVNDHLAFLESVIAKSDLAKDSKQELLTQTQVIQSRAVDPHLYMAVVGEASTGKSTFINALLGDTLLETHALVMTTTMQTRIQYGSEKEVSLSFPSSHNGHARQEHRFTTVDEPITLNEISGIQNLTLHQLIRACTTRSEIIAQLDNLTLYYPSEFLESGICIIDTPGADATEEMHAQIAREAVDFSDAAIIITPAKQIVANTLVQIIQYDLNLLPLMHRCIILVTGMDMIRKKERDRLVQSVHKRLQQKFNLTALPPILPVSAQSVVDAFSGEVPIVHDPTDRADWQKQFETTKAELFTHLKRQRALTISEKLLRLIDQLFATLETHLEAQWEQYNEERQTLDTAVIPDLTTFANAQHQECDDTLRPLTDTTAVQTVLAVDNHRDKLLKKIERSVAGADSLDALKSYIKDELPNQVAQQQNALQVDLEPHFDILRRAARSLSRTFDDRFSKAYNRLRVLGSQDREEKTGPQLALSARDLAAMADSNDAFSGPSFGQMATGAVIGGVVGAIVLPGVGWLIAAWLGQKVVKWFGPSLDKRKEQLMEELMPQIRQRFVEARANVNQGVKTYGLTLQTAVDDHIDNHVRHYRQTVQQMRQEQKQQAKQLQSRQDLLEQDQAELKRRRKAITNKLSSLQTITI